VGNACQDRDLQVIKAEKRQVAVTMNAKIHNVMELYSGAKMVDDKYDKTNVAGSIDREFTVLCVHFLCNVYLSQISPFAIWFSWLLQSASQELIPLLCTVLNHIVHELEHTFVTAITVLSITIGKHECL
jgi:hypothetical protein